MCPLLDIEVNKHMSVSKKIKAVQFVCKEHRKFDVVTMVGCGKPCISCMAIS